jgi:L-aspartate oxidase
MKPQDDAALIVVGSGVAGLTAALAAADQGAHVRLVTAGQPLSGSSWWAQGGIAAAIGRDDRPAYHAADTMAVGADLNDRRAVDVLVQEGRRAITTLVQGGMPFDPGLDGPDLGLEAGHGHRRILHAGGGATGEMVSTALLNRVTRHARITLVPQTPVDRLLTEDGRVAGVASGDVTLRGRAVVLATGGYAGLWGRSTNPPGNRGQGLSLAYAAGATLADLEFVQFHPTALAQPGAPAFLLSEALRGEGARLVDGQERPVVDPLLPRDVVARAIGRHLQQNGAVYLSLRHLDAYFVRGRFPNIARYLASWGLDLARDLLPVAPAAHYCMGGVRTDTAGRTDVPGLYVAGEAACTGAQGANRLASNSLLECLVFGKRAALAALADSGSRHAHWTAKQLPSAECEMRNSDESSVISYQSSVLGTLLDQDLGVEREGTRLQALICRLPERTDPTAPGDWLLAGLAAQAAWLRAESRGAHHRLDTPQPDPAWRGRILWRQNAPPQFEEVHA